MIPLTGPFHFARGSSPDHWWDIHDAKGLPVLDITACLIDGSGRLKERGGYIRTREERTLDAKWVLDALNDAWKRQQESTT